MTDTLTELEQLLEQEVSTGNRHYVHIVNPPDNIHIQLHADMAMTAGEIVAYARHHRLEVICLCGYKFIPSRNPEALDDTCPICLDVAGMLMRNAGE